MSYKLCVRPYGAIAYKSHATRQKLSLSPRFRQPRQNTSPGKLSPNARRKLMNAIRWLEKGARWKKVYEKRSKKVERWKVNMITLTFHENMTDDTLARKLLSMWLEMAKYRWGLNCYVWKAEPQARGAIHFHITTDIYIPYAELRYTWNRLLRKHGLNNIEDNSTDVHAVTGVENLVGYLVEYMCNEDKHEGRRVIQGKLWGCSHSLSKAGKDYLYIDENEICAIENDLDKYHIRHRINPVFWETKPWLRMIDVWYLPNNYFDLLPDCDFKTLYRTELLRLEPNYNKNLSLFPDRYAA